MVASLASCKAAEGHEPAAHRRTQPIVLLGHERADPRLGRMKTCPADVNVFRYKRDAGRALLSKLLEFLRTREKRGHGGDVPSCTPRRWYLPLGQRI
jgi:hypothetical protein